MKNGDLLQHDKVYNKFQKLIKKDLLFYLISVFKSIVMECNKELFPDRWYEKSTFPKLTIQIMCTLAEICYGKNAATLFFI